MSLLPPFNLRAIATAAATATAHATVGVHFSHLSEAEKWRNENGIENAVRNFLRHGSTQRHHTAHPHSVAAIRISTCISGDSIQFMCSTYSPPAACVSCENAVLLLVLETRKNGSRCIVVDQNKQFHFLVRRFFFLSFLLRFRRSFFSYGVANKKATRNRGGVGRVTERKGGWREREKTKREGMK